MRLYRYVIEGTDDFLDDFEYRITLLEFDSKKDTSCGWWIDSPHRTKSGKMVMQRWIAKGARKCFAYTEKSKALDSLIRRTSRRVSILTQELNKSTTGLILAKTLKKQINP